jgi:tetratricopeptide (TPR) repeat protein
MKTRLAQGSCLLLALAVIGAAPLMDAEDLVRQGNGAYARGEFDRAADLYQQAEEHTTDPGLVAFNKATALAARGQFAEAATLYWLCLGDAGPQIAARLRQQPDRALPGRLVGAAGPRLIRVLYNLGTSALQESQGKNPDLTEQAAVYFDHCLRLDPRDGTLRSNARHNLELAKEFLRLNPRPPGHDRKTNPDQPPDDKPPRKDPNGNEQTDNGNEPDRGQNGKTSNDRQTDPGDNPLATEERTAGKGNLAPLPDQDELVPLSRDEVAQHLRQAVARILGERREYQKQAYSNKSSHVLDW